MASNILEFALGLTTGNFISALGTATGGVKEFLAGLVSVGALADGVFGAIERGAALEALHKRTGESVQDLFELQKGFQAAGLSGDDVQSTLLHMQRAIGGVNEMGEKTPDIFRRLGLNIETLRGQDAPKQLESIVTALGKLNSSSAANTAGSIFGRFDYANIIQLMNSTKEVGEAMNNAAVAGRNWERVSAAFEQIEIAWNRVKEIGSGFFAGIAEGMVPALQQGLAILQSFQGTITSIGQKIGHMFTGIAEAFKEGKLLELLEMTFEAGVEYFTNILSGTIGSGGFWMGIFKVMAGSFGIQFFAMLKIVASIGQVMIAAFDTAFQHMVELMSKVMPAVGLAMNLTGLKVQSFAQNYSDAQKTGAAGMDTVTGLMTGSADLGVEGARQTGTAVTDAFKNSGGPMQEALKNFWAGLVGRGTAALPKTADTKGAGGDVLDQKGTYKLEGNALEKMGFVMGGANPAIDYQRRTAIATEKMATLFHTVQGAFTSTAGSFNAV